MSELEIEFMGHAKLALGRHPDLRLWRQNCGEVPVRDRSGKVMRVFNAGPPNGAADMSGFVRPEGWRLEIEFKAADGELSPDQIIFRRNVIAGGCVYVLAEYDEGLDMASNVSRVVADVEAAIARKRKRRR